MVSLLSDGERRLEADAYLSEGYGIRLAIESRRSGWRRLGELCEVSMPPRTRGIEVGPGHGVSYLAATQAFDRRPAPRRWLAVQQLEHASSLLVDQETILVTRSGAVGRVVSAYGPLRERLISDDLLRVRGDDHDYGWLYAYLRSSRGRAMMTSEKYGHIIKHLQPVHISTLPVVDVSMRVRKDFGQRVRDVYAKRDLALRLLDDAAQLLSERVGELPSGVGAEIGFSVPSTAMMRGRRRLEVTYHHPRVGSILQAFAAEGLKVMRLEQVTNGVWWLSRFSRVFGDGGMPYKSADDLFSFNNIHQKKVLVSQMDDPEQYLVRGGWIMMACSGQTYGLLGSVRLMSESDESVFFTHDLVRIVPDDAQIRAGYLSVALGHQDLGRPLVIRNAYGTSVPHLDPGDVKQIPIVRIEQRLEDEIADLAVRAVDIQGEADAEDDSIAHDADMLIQGFLEGD